MGRFRLPRRAFLAGVGGTVVALPFLEVMGDRRARADAGTAPCRYLVVFGGVSVGTSADMFVPDTVGPGYDLKRALEPLAAHEVTGDVGVVSGLRIPWQTSGGIPAGGRPAAFHASTVGPLLSGVHATGRDAAARGPTSDQIVADSIGGETRFRSLEYRAQAAAYRGGESAKGLMSYRRSGDGVAANPPIASPQLAYDSLFTGFVGDDPVEAERRRQALARDRSVLDLVSGNAERLMTRLGRPDRVRLERHFDEIRDLERRLAEIPDVASSACTMLPHPGEDTPVSISTYAGGDTEIGYADETLRARVMCDLVHMAFACDLTRVATLMLTYSQSFLNVESIVGVRTDMHELGHGAGSLDQMSTGIGWHVDHFAYLIRKMRDTPEGDGTLLDNVAAAFVMEGGRGYDPESGEDGKSHSSENMAALYAGRAGLLAPGRHVRAPDAHPAQVLVSAMEAVGVTQPLGEVSGRIDGMFG